MSADAGDAFRVAASDRAAKRVYAQAKREREAREAQLQHSASLDALFGEISRGDVSSLNLIVKTDVVGSVEALRDSLERLSNEEVAVKVIHAAAGAVTGNDVNLALASEGIVIAFNCTVEPGAARLAGTEGVEIRTYTVIYQVIEEVEAAITGMLRPVKMQVVDAHAEVLQGVPDSRTRQDRRLPRAQREHQAWAAGARLPSWRAGRGGRNPQSAPLPGRRAGGRRRAGMRRRINELRRFRAGRPA